MWGVALLPSFPSRFSFWDDETKTLGEFNGVLKDRYIGREREREGQKNSVEVREERSWDGKEGARTK